MRKFLYYLPLVIIIPLGIISKILYYLHKGFNDIVLGYERRLRRNRTKVWKTLHNQESILSAWEIINKDHDFGTDEKSTNIVLMYFTEHDNEPKFQVEVTKEEFEDLLEFTKFLNKNIQK